MNKSKIPTIIAIFILLSGVITGVLLLQQKQIFKLGATGEISPKSVKVTNIGESSFAVSWTTDKKVLSYIKWGEDQNPKKTTQEENPEVSNLHYITLRNLTPNKTYYFKINSDGKDFDNNGIPWQTQTATSLEPPSEPVVISGNVLQGNGQPAVEAIVYVSSGGVSPLSTKTSEKGEWVIPLGSARTSTLSSYATIDNNTLLEIIIDSGPSGVGTAQVYPQGANPTPQMVLGRTYDFRNQTNPGSEQSPEAAIQLPEDSTSSSQFTTSPSTSKTNQEVTLESLDNGETIFTAKPEFFGEGPAGATITIKVESELLSDQVTVPSSGEWNWSPEGTLEEGTHTVTLSWRDSTGILKTITRTFIVNAASQEPSFESTPSGQTATATPKPSPTSTPKPTKTPTPTPKSSPTPKPTSTPTPSPSRSPSPSPSPSATPRISTPATGSAVPTAGTTTQTALLALAGLSMLLGGIFLSLKSSAN